MFPRILLALLFVILVGLSSGYGQARPGASPPVQLAASSGGRVWVYLPTGVAPGAKIPCVIVPPAGGKLFIGMKLSDGDREEHWPYAQAGFAVISFDISGVWEDQNSEASMKKALVGYMNAQCGINDASEALRVTLAKYPQIDVRRLYVAGHSSAGTLALQIAAAAPDQIKGCAAFAPLTDVEKHLAEGLPAMDKFLPGFARVIRENSPANRMNAIRCPVFLFHALDDKGITPPMVTGYRDALLARGKKVDYAVVPTGGHYDSMIKDGIPKAVVWLKALDAAQPK
jgi:dipeptidyl aminopeptidase/acylaminoacyl peptidase